MTDLSKLMQNAALLDVIDKSADEASVLSAQNSYQAQRIEELERENELAKTAYLGLKAENAALRAIADRLEGERETLRQANGSLITANRELMANNARNAALEEAARMLEERYGVWNDVAQKCCEDIRGMKK